MQKIFNKDGFNWWIGVVEDRMDPEFLGRCRVRIFGYHTDDKDRLPVTGLPWAIPIQPITSAAMSGKGSSPLGPVDPVGPPGIPSSPLGPVGPCSICGY